MLFFFKQKAAYEFEYGLVGSEMCIRDRRDGPRRVDLVRVAADRRRVDRQHGFDDGGHGLGAVSYTHLTLPTSDLV